MTPHSEFTGGYVSANLHAHIIMGHQLKSRTRNEVEIVSFTYNYNITLESITFQCDVFWIEYFRIQNHENVWCTHAPQPPTHTHSPIPMKNMSNTRTEIQYFVTESANTIDYIMIVSSSRPPYFEWINIIPPFDLYHVK